MYKIIFHKQILKDFEKLKNNKTLALKTKKLLELIEVNPFQSPPSYEKLNGELREMYSRRINIKHRLVYSVSEKEKIVYIYSA